MISTSSASSTPHCLPKANAAGSTNNASVPCSSMDLSTPILDGIGHVAICDIEHVRYVPPYKRTYMRFVGAPVLTRPKKTPSWDSFPSHRTSPVRLDFSLSFR